LPAGSSRPPGYSQTSSPPWVRTAAAPFALAWAINRLLSVPHASRVVRSGGPPHGFRRSVAACLILLCRPCRCGARLLAALTRPAAAPLAPSRAAPAARWALPAATSVPGLGSSPATSVPELAHPRRICDGIGLAPARFAPGLRSPLPDFGRDWAHPCCIYDGIWLIPATYAPRLGSPLPHLHRDWAHSCHICPETALPHLRRDWAQPCHTRSGTATAHRSPCAAHELDPPRSDHAACDVGVTEPARRTAPRRVGVAKSTRAAAAAPVRRRRGYSQGDQGTLWPSSRTQGALSGYSRYSFVLTALVVR
jgi:hypothetical protein